MVYALMWAVVLLASLSAVLALVWAVHHQQFDALERGAGSIFIDDPPGGDPADGFPPS